MGLGYCPYGVYFEISLGAEVLPVRGLLWAFSWSMGILYGSAGDAETSGASLHFVFSMTR